MTHVGGALASSTYVATGGRASYRDAAMKSVKEEEPALAQWTSQITPYRPRTLMSVLGQHCPRTLMLAGHLVRTLLVFTFSRFMPANTFGAERRVSSGGCGTVFYARSSVCCIYHHAAHRHSRAARPAVPFHPIGRPGPQPRPTSSPATSSRRASPRQHGSTSLNPEHEPISTNGPASHH